MSRATELAKAEAEAAEAEAAEEEERDPTEPPEMDPDNWTEPDDGLSLEASLKAFEKENVRHADEVASIMGEDFEAMTACEQCNGVGFRPADPYKRDPALTTCEHCGGYGMLVTGSLDPNNAVRACTVCQGNGYVVKMDVPAPAPVAPAGPRFDPYTGQPLAPTGTYPSTPTEGNGQWAPGYTPPPMPFPTGS